MDENFSLTVKANGITYQASVTHFTDGNEHKYRATVEPGDAHVIFSYNTNLLTLTAYPLDELSPEVENALSFAIEEYVMYGA
jgi:hypothetical protein